LKSKIIIFITVILTVSLFLSLLFLDESMNLNFIIIIVQDKTLIISEIKKICNKWKLCYYCKLQHLSKIIKECLNKKFFTLHIMNIYNNDIINIDEEISLSAKKFSFWAKLCSEICIHIILSTSFNLFTLTSII